MNNTINLDSLLDDVETYLAAQYRRRQARERLLAQSRQQSQVQAWHGIIGVVCLGMAVAMLFWL